MRDEDFEVFIDEVGEADTSVSVPPDAIEAWRGKLPDQLLAYWQAEGWSSYLNGLFWTVNPEPYEELVEEWLADTPLEGIDRFHVIARSAFGELYLCGEKSGPNVSILAPVHALVFFSKDLKPKGGEDLDFEVRTFFSARDAVDGDLKDENKRPLFQRALHKLGPLESDEIYGFEPPLVSGGRLVLENLKKVKLEPHLKILRQLSPPRIPFSGKDVEGFLQGQ